MIANESLTQLVKTIANRIRDPDQVNQILLHPSNRNEDPLFPERLNPSLEKFRLLEDYPGILLLLAELDQLFPNEKWDASVHHYVLKMKDMIESQGVFSLALFGGIAGIAFALQKASRGGTRYQRMIESLNERILKDVDEDYLLALEQNDHSRQPSPFALYDLIQGIVGIGVYCLNHLNDIRLAKLAEKITHRLVNLTKPLEMEDRVVPGWYLPHSLQFIKEDKEKFPNGNYNLGLAHGIPGVLAFLSVALLRGIEVEGQKEAMQRIIEWIQKHRQDYQGNLFWGTHVSFEEEIDASKSKKCLSTKRNGWCYGTTGVSRSLFLASKALKSNELKSYALESFCSIFIQSRQEWNLPSPTFCHGIAGLLMTTWVMANDTQSPFLHTQAMLLKEIILDYYQDKHPFGFMNLEPRRQGGFVEISQLSLIEGVSGILLTLLSLDGLSTWWHAPFLISEGL